MDKLKVNEIREKYLSFFESKGHLRLPSFSLMPHGDPSLLLINAGMAPLKAWFAGTETPPQNRVTTCQKCVRTPDIERVGYTSRHGTYFEMLGNFSFGDYFKSEAAAWAWEYVTEVMKMPKERLYVTVYLDDDEAWDIWTKQVGVDESHMKRLGRADNFWDIGSGPCGPCSEIYFDRGEQYSCGKEDCFVGCDCDRYVEFWNLVFTQFSNDGSGNYSELPKKNIDTGMGLERIACIMQGVENLFEIDTVANIMRDVCRIAGINYGTGEKSDVSLRIVTDHIRSTTFLVCDGILPSNEGRGYVLRRLLRRAARHGKLLGIDRLFLSEVCKVVINENRDIYPELVQKTDYIVRVIDEEEKRFYKTIDSGMTILNETADKAAAAGGVFSGEDAFKLNDTFGFPIDLTVEILTERGLTVDRDGFDRLMDEQKTRARAAKKQAGESGWDAAEQGAIAGEKTVFTGYGTLVCESEIVAIVVGGESRGSISEGDGAVIILDSTSFYGEGGGQTGDTGKLTAQSGTFIVTDTKKTNDGRYLHIGRVERGGFTIGQKLTGEVNATRRNAVMRAHSSTHLLQKALREVLGDHVEQSGSFVESDRARFDFTHFAAMTEDEISRVEAEVNNAILAGMDITIREMPIADAKKEGATALFGEKYGETVRVVKMGDYSTELCGGTHLQNTSRAGLFKIISESSVAAGVRRIEAVTGSGVLDLLSQKQCLIDDTAEIIKSNAGDIPRRARQLMGEIKEKQQEIDRLNSKLAAGGIDEIMQNAVDAGGVRVVTARYDDMPADALRSLGDTLKDKYSDTAALLASVSDGKISFTAVCGKDAVSRGANAGKLAGEAAKMCGGGGGGRPDGATAGGKDASKLDDALAAAAGIVKSMLK